MADSNIGSLPQAANLDDDSLLVAEQQGQAVKVTGAQFKEFGRQAVIGQVQGYVDQAEEAASRAEDAVSAVTGMTVEADTLPSGQKATVTKSIKQGKVNLAFGLPRGEQGVPGPAGPEGPRGPKGEAGAGLDIVGRYDTTADVPNPQEGKSYYIGVQPPYDLCTYINGEWVNNGPVSGGGGGPLPENVVTAGGGASMTFPAGLGAGPHTITFTDEEEPPLTAGDIAYSDSQNVKQAIDGLKSSVSDGKALVASAITDKGVPTAQDATFVQMAEHIGQIATGSDTSDATATSFDILAPKTAYTAAGKVEGVIPTLSGQTIVPGTADKTIANGQYLGGTQVIKGDPNLTSGNIKSGVTLFGVEGALESSFKATLTVTADTGAVVTATHTDGTEVEALSTTGTVVLDLPLEGTWKVTAVRGVAQYNTVTVQVSSSYSAALTAEVHIEHFGTAKTLSAASAEFAGASTKDYAIFAGSVNETYGANVYNKTLTLSYLLFQSNYYTYENAGASAGDNAVFCGGRNQNFGRSGPSYFVNNELTISSLSSDSSLKAGANFGKYAVFFGGISNYGSDSSVVFFDETAVRTTAADALLTPGMGAAEANSNYAIFCAASQTAVTAYDSAKTQIIPASLPESSYYILAVRAGNYVVFVTSDFCYAYDLFLTRTSVEPLRFSRNHPMCTTINDMAMIAGGRYVENNKNVATGVVDIYDPMLARLATEDTVARWNGTAAVVGNYALFAGGYTRDNSQTSVVDVYRYV